jgi:hypothetical protein
MWLALPGLIWCAGGFYLGTHGWDSGSEWYPTSGFDWYLVVGFVIAVLTNVALWLRDS